MASLGFFCLGRGEMAWIETFEWKICCYELVIKEVIMAMFDVWDLFASLVQLIEDLNKSNVALYWVY